MRRIKVLQVVIGWQYWSGRWYSDGNWGMAENLWDRYTKLECTLHAMLYIYTIRTSLVHSMQDPHIPTWQQKQLRAAHFFPSMNTKVERSLQSDQMHTAVCKRIDDSFVHCPFVHSQKSSDHVVLLIKKHDISQWPTMCLFMILSWIMVGYRRAFCAISRKALLDYSGLQKISESKGQKSTRLQTAVAIL